MIDYRVIALETYPHKPHLEYFMSMQYPQACVTADVDVTELRKFCRQENCSFFSDFPECGRPVSGQYPTVPAAEQQRKAREKLSLDEDSEIEAFYFPSCVPWIRFSEIIHPMADRFDSNPKFSWGKYSKDFRGRLMMPLTVAVHHGLVGGIHLGRFCAEVDRNMAALTAGTLAY